MNVRLLRCAVLENADKDVLTADFNKLCKGEAVTTSGTYAAGFFDKQNLVGVEVAGNRIVLFYTE